MATKTIGRALGEAVLKGGADKELSWFNPHMAAASRAILERLPLVDVLVEVRDARAPISSKYEHTRNFPSSRHIVVLNKTDLANRLQTHFFVAKKYSFWGVALIIPIEHSTNVLEVESEVENELQRFKNAMKMYFKSQGKEVVFFEWVSKHISHTNIQAIPIPLSKASIVRGFFSLAAEKLGFKFLEIKNASDGKKTLIVEYNKSGGIFYVELPDGTILCHSVEENEKFSAQFGREVLAGLLNVADRADWKVCKLSKEEEVNVMEGFKMRFEKFDPTQ